jgi:hypothetical protein
MARFLVLLLLVCVSQPALAIDFVFEMEHASNERFKVEYVLPNRIPQITELPVWVQDRKEHIESEELAIKRGDSKDDIVRQRQRFLRLLMYPIRVTDNETGFVYVVAKDRRTISAMNSNGEIAWIANPFEDAKLRPYRFIHPFIVYLGPLRPQNNPRPFKLRVGFNSSQYGDIELASGKFHFCGQD